MSILLELTAEEETMLAARAKQAGQEPERFALNVVREKLSGNGHFTPRPEPAWLTEQIAQKPGALQAWKDLYRAAADETETEEELQAALADFKRRR